MNVYIETNFVLELAFVQEQHDACAKILALCETGIAHLVLPAFCIAESYERLIRRANNRRQIANDLEPELREISRSEPYVSEVDALQSITSLLVRCSQDEDQRLNNVLEQLLAVADVIPFETGILLNAARYRVEFKLGPQDSFVYSSVMHHLGSTARGESCFINKDRRDFADPDIEEALMNQGCKILFRFDDGYGYIQHRLGATSGD